MPIHVAITRTVRPGCERAFENSLRELFQDSLARQGVLGVHLIVPAQGSNTRQYGILRSFSDEHERDEFYESPLFSRWQEKVAELTEGERTYRELHGLEAWFDALQPPPRWKMAVVTWLGVWPTSSLIAIAAIPRLADLPYLISSAIVAATVVVCLTWIVMPTLVKLLKPWLHHGQSAK